MDYLQEENMQQFPGFTTVTSFNLFFANQNMLLKIKVKPIDEKYLLSNFFVVAQSAKLITNLGGQWQQ